MQDQPVSESTSPQRKLLPFMLLALFVAALGVGATMLVLSQSRPTADPNKLSLQFTTEKGEGVLEGVVNSPLKVAVWIPGQDGSQNSAMAAVTLQIVDEAGNPAQYGDKAPGLAYMRPTIDMAVWEYAGSLPSKPGRYHAQVQLKKLYGDTQLQTLDIREPRLQVEPETSEPLRTGYAFNNESDLWLMATDGSRQRRLTFLSPPDEFAEDPAWSPDGGEIAFTYMPKVPRDQIPMTEIWTILPDGTGLRQFVAHGPNELLSDPYWSTDGQYLFFTVETLVPMGDAMTSRDRRIDRLHIGKGERSQWVPSALMPAHGQSSEHLLYLEETQEGFTRQRIVHANPDGEERVVLVPEDRFFGTYGPRMSPNGKWVVFSATEGEGSSKREFDFFRWLLLEPTSAYAHEEPWDLYIVPASGGEPTRLTTLKDDQPYPIWLDNSTIAFIGVTGMYKLGISSDGKAEGEPLKMQEGARHSSITWRGP